jgi:hypothetical protein
MSRDAVLRRQRLFWSLISIRTVIAVATVRPPKPPQLPLVMQGMREDIGFEN